MRDYAVIARHCPKVGERMFRRLAPIKKDMLAVSREFYPLGCAGWERGVESLADRCVHDEEHRLLTTVPPVTLKKAAAGMLQNLTSKGQPWYYLSVPKVLKGSVSNGVRGVLDKLTEASRYVFSRSNAYSSIYRLFVHYLAYGKAFKLDEATFGKGVQFDPKFTERMPAFFKKYGIEPEKANQMANEFAKMQKDVEADLQKKRDSELMYLIH